MTAERALAYLIQGSLTKAQYELTRQLFLEIDLDVLPAYNHVRDAKTGCIPRGLKVTETEAVVPLQSLLDHTALRLLESQSDEDLSSLDPDLTLVAKWGCDGSSGHSIYKQRFSAPGCSDESIFLTAMVPLEVHSRAVTTQP